MFHVPEMYRLLDGKLASTARDGNNGAFMIPYKNKEGGRYWLRVIANDVEGWEHVSVSLAHRIPYWEEMCVIKDLFWDAEDCVVQYHPPKSEYVNTHPYVLHLWRPIGREYIRPHIDLLGGFKDV